MAGVSSTLGRHILQDQKEYMGHTVMLGTQLVFCWIAMLEGFLSFLMD
jgi:hypothetical protein